MRILSAPPAASTAPAASSALLEALETFAQNAGKFELQAARVLARRVAQSSATVAPPRRR